MKTNNFKNKHKLTLFLTLGIIALFGASAGISAGVASGINPASTPVKALAGPQGLKGEQGLQGERGSPGKDGKDADNTKLNKRISDVLKEVDMLALSNNNLIAILTKHDIPGIKNQIKSLRKSTLSKVEIEKLVANVVNKRFTIFEYKAKALEWAQANDGKKIFEDKKSDHSAKLRLKWSLSKSVFGGETWKAKEATILLNWLLENGYELVEGIKSSDGSKAAIILKKLAKSTKSTR